MPSFQTVAERCNVLFGSEGIGALRGQVDLFVSHETLGAIAVRLGIANEDQGRYLDSMPQAMAAALKGLVAENLRRDRPFGMQVVWFEGNHAEYVADLRRRKGDDADMPHRIRYKKLEA